MIRKLGCYVLLCTVFSCAIFNDSLPPKREFRGVWIATVANIDWPKSGTDTWEKQQADFRDLLNFYREHNFNAVIVQIRTAGDAFYPSDYAPWSRYLTGEEGKPPSTENDPLAWMIEETHKRGMEFHAWMNPYRATFSRDTTSLDTIHDYYKFRNWMVGYGSRNYYNPGIPEVREHLVKIVREVVVNYDVDGIHFDDYFYPYKIAGEVFNDSTAYATFGLPEQSLPDWRRANIDSLIAGVSHTIRKWKPGVQFGVSPFGVWRNRDVDPRGSATKAGQTNYDHLYADPLNWIELGWLDYVIPQVYWSMDYGPASFKTLVNWWNGQVANTPLFIGHGAYKIKNNPDKAWKRKRELIKQIKLTRTYPAIDGNVIYNASSLYKNHPEVANMIRRKFFKTPALTPAANASGPILPWQQEFTIRANPGNFQIDLLPAGFSPARQVLLYGAPKKGKLNVDDIRQLVYRDYIDRTSPIYIDKNKLGRSAYFAITFLDEHGRESLPTVITKSEINSYGAER